MGSLFLPFRESFLPQVTVLMQPRIIPTISLVELNSATCLVTKKKKTNVKEYVRKQQKEWVLVTEEKEEKMCSYQHEKSRGVADPADRVT